MHKDTIMNTLTSKSAIFSTSHTLTRLAKDLGMDMQYQGLFSFVLKDVYKLSKEETPVVLYRLVPENTVKDIVYKQEVISTTVDFTLDTEEENVEDQTPFCIEPLVSTFVPPIINTVVSLPPVVEPTEIVFNPEVAKNIISMVHKIHKFDEPISGHLEAQQIYRKYKLMLAYAEENNLKEEAISYYNWIFLNGDKSLFYVIKGVVGNIELANKLVEMSKSIPQTVSINKEEVTMSVMDQIKNKSAWGRKEILSLEYGNELSKEMIRMNKTNLSSREIINILFSIKAKECGFMYYNEFVELMKLQKTMINKETAQGLLRMFWENTKDEYKHDTKLFNTIKSIIIGINNSLTNNNSTLQMRTKFIELFVEATL